VQNSHDLLILLHQLRILLSEVRNRLQDLLSRGVIELLFWWAEDVGEDAEELGRVLLDRGVLLLV
jgi:hypothetical protein